MCTYNAETQQRSRWLATLYIAIYNDPEDLWHLINCLLSFSSITSPNLLLFWYYLQILWWICFLGKVARWTQYYMFSTRLRQLIGHERSSGSCKTNRIYYVQTSECKYFKIVTCLCNLPTGLNVYVLVRTYRR